MALISGKQNYQILTNDDEVCIPRLSSVLTVKVQLTNLIFSGPVQSSHYEDSSDDDCDDGNAQGPGSSSGFRRQCSNIGNFIIHFNAFRIKNLLFLIDIVLSMRSHRLWYFHFRSSRRRPIPPGAKPKRRRTFWSV